MPQKYKIFLLNPPLSAYADLSPLSASVGAKRLPPASSAPLGKGGRYWGDNVIFYIFAVFKALGIPTLGKTS